MSYKELEIYLQNKMCKELWFDKNTIGMPKGNTYSHREYLRILREVKTELGYTRCDIKEYDIERAKALIDKKIQRLKEIYVCAIKYNIDERGNLKNRLVVRVRERGSKERYRYLSGVTSNNIILINYTKDEAKRYSNILKLMHDVEKLIHMGYEVHMVKS